MDPLLVLLGLAAGIGLVAWLVLRRLPASPLMRATMEGGSHRVEGPLRRFVRSRTDAGVATGLALTSAILGLVLAGALVGTATWMIRRDRGVVSVDRAVERWADRQASPLSDDILETVTHLGDTITIVAVGVALSAFGLWRWRRWAIPLFVFLVIAGQFLISNGIKFLVDRARPELRPRAEFTGTSFPSGHSTAAAATYLSVALVLCVGTSPETRAWAAGIAVTIGVAVATTRVLLGVHWFSDAIAGVVIGWAWFGLCAVALSGRSAGVASRRDLRSGSRHEEMAGPSREVEGGEGHASPTTPSIQHRLPSER